MIALSVSLSLLWCLAYCAWREWVSLRKPDNDYSESLNQLRAEIASLTERVEIHDLRAGLKQKGNR